MYLLIAIIAIVNVTLGYFVAARLGYGFSGCNHLSGTALQPSGNTSAGQPVGGTQQLISPLTGPGGDRGR
jgi:hypothetical protein